jgi:hypothetical protein
VIDALRIYSRAIERVQIVHRFLPMEGDACSIGILQRVADECVFCTRLQQARGDVARLRIRIAYLTS